MSRIKVDERVAAVLISPGFLLCAGIIGDDEVRFIGCITAWTEEGPGEKRDLFLFRRDHRARGPIVIRVEAGKQYFPFTFLSGCFRFERN